MTPVIGAGRPRPKAKHLVLIIAIGLVLANAAATQYVAASLAYHPALGSPLAGHIYAPWEWLVWQHKFASHAPQRVPHRYGRHRAGTGLRAVRASRLERAERGTPRRHSRYRPLGKQGRNRSDKLAAAKGPEGRRGLCWRLAR